MICESVHMFLIRLGYIPYSACGIRSQAPTDEQLDRIIEVERECCMKGYVPMRTYAKLEVALIARRARAARLVREWQPRCSPSNLQIEWLHSDQRRMSTKFDKNPKSWAR